MPANSLLHEPVRVTRPRDLQPLAVSLREAARLVGLSDSGLENLIDRGEGPKFLRAGHRRLFRIDALREWLVEREHAGQDQRGDTEISIQDMPP